MVHILNIDIKKLRSSFDNEGYIVLKSFFLPEEMPPLLEAIKTAECAETATKNLSKDSMVFRSNLFYKSKQIQDFISQQKIIDVLKNLAGDNIWTRWDQAVGKGPNSDTFPWHQDNGYTKLPHQQFQFWVAVTKSTAENGAILLSPGSNRLGLMSHKSNGKHLYYDGEVSKSVMVEAEPGDVIIFSSFTLHATRPNTTKDETRWAYVIEYMSLDHYDHQVTSPYFVVARNGKSTSEFIAKHPGKKFSDTLKEISYQIYHRLTLT